LAAPKVIVVEKPSKKVRVVERIKIVEKPVLPSPEIIAFSKKAMHVAGIIQTILTRIEQDRAISKAAKAANPKPERAKSNKPKPAKNLKFNPKAHTGMVDWDKIRHF
jgi:hypothetical protein